MTDSAGTGKGSLEHKWILDSDATRQVKNSLAALKNITSVYGNTVEIHKMGTLKATTVVDKVVKTVFIGEVEYVPEFTKFALGELYPQERIG